MKPSVQLCAFSVVLCVTKKVSRRDTEETRRDTERHGELLRYARNDDTHVTVTRNL